MADYKIETRKIAGIGYQYKIQGQLWSQETFHSKSDAEEKAKSILKNSGI